MNKINTITDLKAERIRLRLKSLQLEEEIRSNVDSIKASFAPLQLIKEGASNMFVNNNKGLVNVGISSIVGFLMRNVLLRNSGFVVRLILPFIAKNTANNFVAQNKTKILGWMGNLFLKAVKKKNKQPLYDSATVDTNF